MTNIQMLRDAVKLLAGHYGLAEWARVMGKVERELPTIIAEIEAARGVKSCSVNS